MEDTIIKMTLMGILFVLGICIIGVNGGVGLGLVLMSAFIFGRLISLTPEQEIEHQIRKRGGKIIEIENNKEYIKEAEKIKPRKRFMLEDVYKTRYSVDESEKALYLVIYRNGTKIKRYWVEEDAS